MTTQISDSDIVSWLVKAGFAVLMFFLSLGVKDIRDRLKSAESTCGRIDKLEERIDNIRREIDDLKRQAN